MPLLLDEMAPIKFGLFLLGLPFYVGLLAWMTFVNIRQGLSRWVVLFLATGLAAIGCWRYAIYQLAEDYHLLFYALPLFVGLGRLALPKNT